MHIIAVAWMFVVILMTAADLSSGEYVDAFALFFGAGLVPLAIVLYLLYTPTRRRRRLEREAEEAVQESDADA